MEDYRKKLKELEAKQAMTIDANNNNDNNQTLNRTLIDLNDYISVQHRDAKNKDKRISMKRFLSSLFKTTRRPKQV